MSDPFKKNKDAGSKESAKVEEKSPSIEPVAQAKAEAKVDVSKLSAKEAKAFVAEQFKAKIPVMVVALQEGEHPRPGAWKKVGQKFKLENPEAYSHRWMKLA